MREEHYLYAIVRGPTPAWRPPAQGVDGVAVTPRSLDDLLVLESRLAGVPPAGPRHLGAHHDVVASALNADALLPFRYGVTVADGALDAWLAERRALVDQALERVRGHVEMSVKILRLDGAAPAEETRLREIADRLVECAGVTHWRRRAAGVPATSRAASRSWCRATRCRASSRASPRLRRARAALPSCRRDRGQRTRSCRPSTAGRSRGWTAPRAPRDGLRKAAGRIRLAAISRGP